MLADGGDGLLDVPVEPDDAAVAEQPGGERLHGDVLETGTGQVKLTGDRRHVDDVVGGRVGVEALAAIGPVRTTATAELVGGFEHLAAVSRALDKAGFAIVASGLKQYLLEGGGDAELDVAQMEKLFLSLA